MATPPPDDENRLAGELIASGEEFAGAAVGGALGLIGGPVGVAAGAAGRALAMRAFRKVGAQLRQRWLDPREPVRVGGAFALAAARIAERTEAGEGLRADGFFDEGATGDRTPADEVLEGMLKAAATAHEERKVPYLATLYAASHRFDTLRLIALTRVVSHRIGAQPFQRVFANPAASMPIGHAGADAPRLPLHV